MELNKDKKEEKEGFEAYRNRIHFKSVPVDSDAAFEKLWHRIKEGEVIPIGVSSAWKYVSVAATVALLIVSSVLYRVSKETIRTDYLEVVAMAGAKTRVLLPDSTVVWLNSRAKIRYPQQFTADSRVVEFEGEARFEVKKENEKPFIVDVDGMRVQVLGTVFNIYADVHSEVIETTLLKGKVAIFSRNNTSSVPDNILSANQQAVFNKGNNQLEIREVKASLYTSWADGFFDFENNTLQEIMSRLERAFDTQIHLESPDLGTKRFTAQFTHQETLDEILSILQVSAKYQYKKIKGEIYMTDK